MNKLKYLALSFGLIYVWFGILKFSQNLSPAEDLASQTVEVITFHLIPSNVGFFLLALLEVVIGVGLIIGYKRTVFVKIAIVHMLFTFVPLFVFPELSFTRVPYGFTIVGQYIMKNVVFLVALFLLLPSKEIQKTQG
jgi:uncharacterized membrane protein YphA (DoxX/SURF4 family)